MSHLAPFRARSGQLRLGKLLYSDRRMAVLNKYSGVETQVGLTSLYDVADGCSAGPAESVNQDERNVLFSVHRLDKATTGCLMFGRTKDMARELSRQFKGRTIEKTYYAVVRGGSESFKESSGIMNRAIEVSLEGLATLAPPGRESPHGTSVTKWELVGSSPVLPLSLLRLRMHTGHKHQLRIHLSKLLHTPILGDQKHSAKKPTNSILRSLESLNIPPDRLFLHSSSLGIIRHVKTGKRFRLGIQAPFPQDFTELLKHSQIPFDPEASSSQLSVDGQALSDSSVPELDGYLLS